MTLQGHNSNSDIQSLFAKVLCNDFSGKFFLTHVEMIDEIWNIRYTHWRIGGGGAMEGEAVA